MRRQLIILGLTLGLVTALTGGVLADGEMPPPEDRVKTDRPMQSWTAERLRTLRETLAVQRIQPSIGVRTVYDLDSEDWRIGGGLRVPLGERFELLPSADVSLGEQADWQANFDVAFRLQPTSPFYAGGGVALLNTENPVGVRETEFGYNIIGGVDFGRRQAVIRPAAEYRFTSAGDEQFQRVTVGLNFRY